MVLKKYWYLGHAGGVGVEAPPGELAQEAQSTP